ncbi:hypothetical protein H6F86_04770 [Phormidium sp. FACHB-592]|uniref:hypothetical protein n=1 Tax=Stenomitos frigidus TaxID=1886765 RepID=UPI0019CA8566|nr:hypothetical protein [Phormidium sp. FACHB-592]
MRALLIPLLLPVLLASTSCTQAVLSAKAIDDRPASLKPAIAKPVTAPPTIKSLAGTYKGVVDEQWLAKFLEEERKTGLSDKELKRLAEFARHMFEDCEITLHADSGFDFQDLDAKKVQGKVKVNGNQLLLVDSAGKPISIKTDAAINVSTAVALNASADKKKLLFYNPRNPSQLLRVYVKQ